MPVVLRYKGYTFFFYSNEGVPREPLHVHVRQGSTKAKIWLEPDVMVADSFGMTAQDGRIIFMSKSLALRVRFDDDNMWVELSDGRTLGVPLAYFPRLLNASAQQRKQYVISGAGTGLHCTKADWSRTLGLARENTCSGHNAERSTAARTLMSIAFTIVGGG